MNDNPTKLHNDVKIMEKTIEKLKRIELQEFTNYLSSPWRIIWANFLAGTARGLGFLIGAALIITIAGVVLTKFLSQIPFVGDFFQAIDIWIKDALAQVKNVN